MVSKYESLETEEPPVISDQRLLRYREDLRTRMEFFLNHAGEGKPYKREEIEGDILKCKQQREKWGATNVRSSLAEIIIALVPHSSGWLGERTRERGRHTIVTEEPDDFFYNHIDCVKEISYATAGTVVRWAEDVTRHHPENDYAQDTPQTSESFGQVEAKVLGMREAIGKGKSPGEVHYFSSVASEEDLETPLIGPMPMPKAIISVPSKVALELRKLYPGDQPGTIDLIDELKNHPFREEYLAQIKSAMEAQIRWADEALVYESLEERHQTLTKLKIQAQEVLDLIIGLMANPERDTNNEWLRKAYQKTLYPKSFA